MKSTTSKLKILGWKSFFSIFFDVVASKIYSLRSKNYVKRMKSWNLFQQEGWKPVSIEGGKWTISNDTTTLVLRESDSDVTVFKQILVQDEYKQVLDIIKQSQLKITKMLDLGANIGLTSVVFGKEIQGLQITAVEPSSENAAILKENMDRNGINCDIKHHGVWSSTTKLKIETDFRDGQSWSLTVKENLSGSIDALDMNSLVEGGVDFVKMDVEGTEFELFKDPNYAKEFLSKIRIIAIEIHEDVGDPDLIIEQLEKSGFELSYSGELTIGVKR